MLTDAEWCKNDAGNQDWKDAAEFEARVAVYLAKSPCLTCPDNSRNCPRKNSPEKGRPFFEACRIKHARIAVEKEMEQEAYQTAALAWGGEIPSPLPGHTRMTEEEADWLAENCWKKPEVEYHPLREMRGGFFCDACPHDYDCRKCWREAARKAVEANHD